MKNIGKKLLLVGLLSTSIVSAKIAFDLQAQHFSKALEGEYEGARYELPKTFVSTNLKYVEGVYLTKNAGGYVNVELKTPLVNWSTSTDVYYIMGDNQKKTRTMKWTSDNGESILVSFKYESIMFNNKKVYTPKKFDRMTVTLTQKGDDISLAINGTQIESITRPSFGKLKYLDIQAIYEYDYRTDTLWSNYYDHINAITIGSK